MINQFNVFFHVMGISEETLQLVSNRAPKCELYVCLMPANALFV